MAYRNTLTANARKAYRAQHLAIVQEGKVNGLLADPLSNPKVAKNGKLGVLTAPLHLAPASLSGFNVCAQASKGCIAACLHTAGNPAAMAGKTRARIARTQLYFNERESFLALLVLEVMAHVQRAERSNMAAAIRLNATSDIAWERVPVLLHGVRYPNIMDAFPDVQFYDYTKITKRAIAAATGAQGWPVNYHLTFSLTESNDSAARLVLESGGNVAAVFNVRRNWTLPSRFTIDGLSVRVVDADEHDFRPDDNQYQRRGLGVISGLRAKGDAIKDASGFVRKVKVRRLAMRVAKAA